MRTPGTRASTQNSHGDSRTPPATSAHGTRPSSANMIVVAFVPSCSPKIGSRAAPTPARAISSVVETPVRPSDIRSSGMVQP